MELRVVHDVIDVDDAIAKAARVRAVLEPFAASGAARRRWSLASEPSLDRGHALQLEGEQLGMLVSDGDALRVRLSSHELAGLAALRAAWFLSTADQGGVLLHGSAVSFGDKAVAAVGPSGSGKSTLARLCVGSGRATLLSDEIIALMPDGTCFGTPFHSDLKLPGSSGGQRLAMVLSLTHDDHEALRPARPADHARLLLSQAFRWSAPGVLDQGGMLERISAAVANVRMADLHFRKDPAVADFLERELR